MGRLDELRAAIRTPDVGLVSADLFDTVLLRDTTTETVRLAHAALRAAAELGVDPDALTRLRWSVHDLAYTAVALERPDGEARLVAMTRTMATALRLGDGAADRLREIEVAEDAAHLRPNRPLLAVLDEAARAGTRVVATSDTWYGEADLHRLLGLVAGRHPIAAVYSSADLQRTKHAGGLYRLVAEREGIAPECILHIGDNRGVDVGAAEQAGWRAVHLPRGRRHVIYGMAGRARALRARARRVR